MGKQKGAEAEFGQAPTLVRGPTLVLRLYVTGLTPKSGEAITAIKAVCQEHFAGDFNLEVIDIYQQPGLAAEAQVVAAPMLIKREPLPLRRLLGTFSNLKEMLLQIKREREVAGGSDEGQRETAP